MTDPPGAIATPRLTIRVGGLGHSLTLRESATATVAELQSKIEEGTGIPPCYQRLLARGLNFEDSTLTLEEVGLKDRTKLMLLHSSAYAQEKDVYEQLMKESKEIDDLNEQVVANSIEPKVVAEMVTRICCRLDAIDTAGSANLRLQRKELLRKAEQLEEKHQDEN